MPLYEYKCNSCGGVFEVRQKVSDEPLSVHENCGGVLERLISPSAFQFKGSGWYITDYARSGKTKSDGNGAAKENKSEGDASKSSASKEAPPVSSSTSETAKSK